MYMLFNHPSKGWSVGFLYDRSPIPEHLQIFLANNSELHVKNLVQWLDSHNVRGVAYCAGNWIEKIQSRRFIKRFNAEMAKHGILADLGELYSAVLQTDNN